MMSATPHAEALNLDRLLNPRSVVIVGASAREGTPGARIQSGLERLGYPGDVFLVNPNRAEIAGRACVGSVAEIPEGVDLGVLCVSRDRVQAAMEACIDRGVGAIVIFAAGYAEQDDAGAADQLELAEICRRANVPLLGPNCLGFASMRSRAPITMVNIPHATSAPGVSIIAQSGAIMSSLFATMQLKGTNVSNLISVGNQAVLGIEDFVERFVDDDDTRVITVFAERLRQPQRFLALAKRARAKRKPIVLMHTGRSRMAQSAAQSHTGAMAGDDAVMRALTAHEGVILVDSLDELADVSALIARYPVPPTKGVGIVTNSGAFRGISFDYCERVGLDIPDLDRSTVDEMSRRLPSFAVAENPMDLTVQTIAEPDLIGIAARTLLDDPNVGSCVLAVHAGVEAVEYAKHVGPMLSDVEQPVAYCLLGEGAPAPDELIATLRESGIPLFRSVERGLKAIARLTEYGRNLANLAGSDARPDVASSTSNEILRAGTWTEAESKSWLEGLGLPVPQGEIVVDLIAARATAAAIGYPVVLKAQATQLTHKSDSGGVALGITDEAALDGAWETLQANVARLDPPVTLDGVLVERMATKGVELVVGFRRDPDWGPVLLLGLGGIWIEVIKDVRLMPATVGVESIVEEILRLKGQSMLTGGRGRPAADILSVAKIAHRLAEAALRNPALVEVDLNPVVAFAEGQGAVVLDALVVCSDDSNIEGP